MNYKELCISTINHRYSDIEGIKEENLTMESRPIKKIKDNWVIFGFMVAVVIGLLLVNFVPRNFFVCIGLFVFFVLVFITGNKYSLTCDKKTINIKQHFQTMHIPYENIRNVFISRTARFSIIHTYVLVIRCKDNFSITREFEFPLLCADIADVTKFINNFKLATRRSGDADKYEKRKLLRDILTNIMSIAIFVFILWYMLANGIINFF